MKKTLYLSLFMVLFITITSRAQPISGIKGGVNMSFMKDNSFYEIMPQAGWQLGYSWTFKLNSKYSLSLDAMWTKRSLRIRNESFDQSEVGSFLSAPLAFNYNIKKWYFSLGYEFAHRLPLGDYSLHSNIVDHQGFIGVGYNFKYFDLALRYATSLNDEKTGIHVLDLTNPDNYIRTTSRMSTLQLNIIFHFGKH